MLRLEARCSASFAPRPCEDASWSRAPSSWRSFFPALAGARRFARSLTVQASAPLAFALSVNKLNCSKRCPWRIFMALPVGTRHFSLHFMLKAILPVSAYEREGVRLRFGPLFYAKCWGYQASAWLRCLRSDPCVACGLRLLHFAAPYLNARLFFLLLHSL